MTENPNVGNAPATGAEGTPNPAVSQQGTPPIEANDQLLSTLQSLSAEFKTLKKELGGLQSRQDKAENSFAERLAKLDQYEKSGMTRDQALARMDADESDVNWRRKLETQLSEIAARLENGGTQTNRQQQVAEVFASKGLDPKDPRIAQFLVKEYSSPEAMELAAYRLKEELASPNPTNAQNASLNGGSPKSGNADEMFSRLEVLYKNYTQNLPEIQQIESELKAAGHMR